MSIQVIEIILMACLSVQAKILEARENTQYNYSTSKGHSLVSSLFVMH